MAYKKSIDKRIDVFHAFLVKDANYDGQEEIPIIKTSQLLPEKLTLFSQALSTNDHNQWVAFYEYDYKFVRLWRNPRQYLGLLKKFKGVITPDFSLYRNMPLVMQKWSTYQGKALGHWLHQQGIEVIPNVRFADERSFDFCFNGVESNSTVAIGTHGCLRVPRERQFFVQGLSEMISRLSPKVIVVYGPAPESIFAQYKASGITILQFPSRTATYYKSKQGK